MAIRIAVLTISDLGFQGKRVDTSGKAIADWAAAQGFEVSSRDIVPDESDRIASVLSRWADDGAADVIITTGGTGLSPRDVTPEATRMVIERDVPGIAEAIRAAGQARTPRSALSRGLAGARAQTLIVNLPGSPSRVKEGLKVLEPIVEHAVQLLTGRPTDHTGGQGGTAGRRDGGSGKQEPAKGKRRAPK